MKSAIKESAALTTKARDKATTTRAASVFQGEKSWHLIAAYLNMSNVSTSVNKTSAIIKSSPSNPAVIAEVLPIAVVIVLVNSLVFYLFLKQGKLRTPTNCLLLSLAVCDFMTGFIGIPLFIVVVVMHTVMPPAAVGHLSDFIIVFHNAMAITAAYHILTITVERYLSILKPFVHHQLTKKSMLRVVILVWFVSIVLSLLPYAWHSKTLSDLVSYKKTQFGYVVFCLIFVFLIPCIVIIVSQFFMFKAISQSGRQCLSSQSASRRRANNDKKCLIIFALMTTIYLACWLPWFVLSLYFTLWFPLSQQTLNALYNMAQVFGIFRFVTSIVNPLLYTFFKRDFLTAFKLHILRRKPTRRDTTLVSQGKSLISS
ncbi:neuromedin-U receptor 2-like isoform X1 [Montipora capricornis]|uniref:neuromedin-U receptor 2-like isoform X1 n=2 Tax=Montipora capricornis TaxID=246305 RepID=UPI0035F1E903